MQQRRVLLIRRWKYVRGIRYEIGAALIWVGVWFLKAEIYGAPDPKDDEAYRQMAEDPREFEW